MFYLSVIRVMKRSGSPQAGKHQRTCGGWCRFVQGGGLQRGERCFVSHIWVSTLPCQQPAAMSHEIWEENTRISRKSLICHLMLAGRVRHSQGGGTASVQHNLKPKQHHSSVVLHQTVQQRNTSSSTIVSVYSAAKIKTLKEYFTATETNVC